MNGPAMFRSQVIEMKEQVSEQQAKFTRER